MSGRIKFNETLLGMNRYCHLIHRIAKLFYQIDKFYQNDRPVICMLLYLELLCCLSREE